MWYIILALVLILLLCFLLAYGVLQIAFGKRCEKNPYFKYFTAEDFPGLNNEKVEFPSADGETLRGYVYTRAENPKAVVVFVHGMGSSHISYTTEIDFLTRQGYSVLGYDNTGTVMSDGKNLRGLMHSISDLDSALTFIESKDYFKGLPILLCGHSWGAFTASHVFCLNHKINGLVAFSGFENAPRVLSDMVKSNVKIPVPFLRPFWSLIFRLQSKKSYCVDTSDSLLKTDVPVLLFHGMKDTAVRYENSPAYLKEKLSKNPLIEIAVYPEKYHNVYNSYAAESALNEFMAESTKLTIKHRGKIPEDVAKEFYGNVDFKKLVEEDEEVMEKVRVFFEKCLSVKKMIQ